MEDPKKPSDKELDALIRSLGFENDDEPAKPLKPLPRALKTEVKERHALLKMIRDAITDKADVTKMGGFVFLSVCDDGVTPVLYAFSGLTNVTARLLISEMALVQERLLRLLNDSEDYVPQEDDDEDIEA